MADAGEKVREARGRFALQERDAQGEGPRGEEALRDDPLRELLEVQRD